MEDIWGGEHWVASRDEARVKQVFKLLKPLESVLHWVQRLLKTGLCKLKMKI